MRRTRSTSGAAQRMYAALLRSAPRFDPGCRFCRLIEPAYIYRQPQRHLRSLLLGLCDAPRATRCGYARPALYMNKRDTHSICIATSRVTRHCRWSLMMMANGGQSRSVTRSSRSLSKWDILFNYEEERKDNVCVCFYSRG